MAPSENKLAPYEERLSDLWERMVRTIGIHTVNVLFERAIWETSQNYPEMALIGHDDNGLSFEALSRGLADRPEGEVAEAFGDLNTQLLLILARLLGKEMAQRLAEELEAKTGKDKGIAAGGEA